MTREQFEHAIRAAGAVLGVSEVLVIGSQAIQWSLSGDLPIEAMRSDVLRALLPTVPEVDERARRAAAAWIES